MHSLRAWLFALALAMAAAGAASPEAMTSTQTRIAADALVREGKFKQAAEMYTQAIALDPNDKMNYFKRAVVRQGMNALKPAVADLTKVLELDPSMSKAIERKAEILKLLGMFAASEAEYRALLAFEPAKASEALSTIQNCAAHKAMADAAFASANFDQAVSSYGVAAECATRDPALRTRRAEAYEKKGDLEGAILDAQRASKLATGDLGALLYLARLHYAHGELEAANSVLGECLRSDESHSGCKDAYKRVKKLRQSWTKGNELLSSGAAADALVKLADAIAVDPEHPRYAPALHALVCSAHLKLRDAAAAVAACNLALRFDERFLDALLRLGEAFTMLESYEEAVRAYARARQHHPNNPDAQRGHETAQRVLKAASRKDFYKILGVARTATTAEINKAYRKLALEWHPDKWQLPEEKAKAELKFHDLALAKEVLGDEEKRRRFDAGEDVESPQPQQQHNPFGNFGGQQFHFRFN